MKSTKHIRFSLAGSWMLFTVSLVTWWMIFGIHQAERLALLDSSEAKELARYQKMLVTEGATMIISLVFGGSALFYYMYRQVKEANRLKIFFASFTHEIKTPLAGASLKLEMLEEKLQGTSHAAGLSKIKQEFQRLSMQIENSLFLADDGREQAIFESIDLRPFLESIAGHGWKGLSEISISGGAIVSADRRMLEAIFGNLLRNANQHGKASRVTVDIRDSGDSKVQIFFQDNGTGFKGDRTRLSLLFTRHYEGSGSGIGLYLVDRLTKAMDGKAWFPDDTVGFLVRLEFNKGL